MLFYDHLLHIISKIESRGHLKFVEILLFIRSQFFIGYEAEARHGLIEYLIQLWVII